MGLGRTSKYPGHLRRIHNGMDGFRVDYYTGKLVNWPRLRHGEQFLLLGVVHADGVERLHSVADKHDVNKWADPNDFARGILKLYAWRP